MYGRPPRFLLTVHTHVYTHLYTRTHTTLAGGMETAREREREREREPSDSKDGRREGGRDATGVVLFLQFVRYPVDLGLEEAHNVLRELEPLGELREGVDRVFCRVVAHLVDFRVELAQYALGARRRGRGRRAGGRSRHGAAAARCHRHGVGRQQYLFSGAFSESTTADS